MKFEEAAAMLAASCGKDIDDNCRGVNLDATRLQGVPGPKSGRGVGEVQGRLSPGSWRHPATHHRARLPCKTVQLGAEPSVRRGATDPVKGLQCLLESTKKATPNCNKAIAAAGYR